MREVVLTGVKPTGMPHIGNYFGAIKPAIDLAQKGQGEGWLFIADYHSLISLHRPQELNQMIYEVAASWLACGLDPEKTVIYRQSDIPELMELNWILSCLCPKGLMNRAHAYKAKVQENKEHGREDLDFGVNMGLYNYPVLMSADILMFNATHVPVGADQLQHLEIARDLAEKFNNTFEEFFVLPQAVLSEKTKIIPGIDGRKMSKSYGNHLPLFEDAKSLRKKVMKIVTDSSAPEEPKDPDHSLLFDMYRFVATPEEVKAMEKKYKEGIGWGYVKQDLFDALERLIQPMREKYQEFMNNKDQMDRILSEGAAKARPRASENLRKIRKAIGLSR